MFENLRRAFREAVDNFKEELNRDDVPEAVGELLKGMYNEVTDAQAYLRKLEEQVARTLKQADRERKEAATCRRREQMAIKIGDKETAGVAREFAEKHEKTTTVLERKALALQEEVEVRKVEVRDMLEKIKEAQKQKNSLAAAAGRTSARASISQTDDLFSELDRMAEKIMGEESRAQAARDLADELDGPPIPEDEWPPVDVDTRLEELKRKMSKE
jgi:phage shock protein A